MKKFSLAFLSIVVFVSIFFSSVSFAATVGQQLPTEEAGWKRYDDGDPSVKYFGTFTRESGEKFYNGAANYATSVDFKIKFDFIGTKIRIIGVQYPQIT